MLAELWLAPIPTLMPPDTLTPTSFECFPFGILHSELVQGEQLIA